MGAEQVSWHDFDSKFDIFQREGNPSVPNSLPSAFTKDDGDGYDDVVGIVALSDNANESFANNNNNSNNNNATGDGAAKCPPVYTSDIGWLPVVLLMVYIFFFNLGYGAMIWITVAEILPLQVIPSKEKQITISRNII